MKNLLLIAILLVTLGVNGQTNKGDLIRKCYVESATAKFDLDEAQQKTLNEAYIVRKQGVNAINKKKKTGELAPVLAESQKRENYIEFIDALKELTGKPEKELTAFDNETHQKCRQ